MLQLSIALYCVILHTLKAHILILVVRKCIPRCCHSVCTHNNTLLYYSLKIQIMLDINFIIFPRNISPFWGGGGIHGSKNEYFFNFWP